MDLHRLLLSTWVAQVFNAVKCNLTKLTTKNNWYLQSAVFVWYCKLIVLHHYTSSPCLPSPPPSLVSTVIGSWKTTWRPMTGLQGLPAMGALYCLGAGWSQWRPLDIPGTCLPFSKIQLLNGNKLSWCSAVVCICNIVSSDIFLGIEWNTWSSSSSVGDCSQEH